MALRQRQNGERYDEDRYSHKFKEQVVRDKIRQATQEDTPKPLTPVMIGRKVLLQSTYQRRVDRHLPPEHPLEKFLYAVEADPRNEAMGRIVSPADLVLRVVTEEKFNEQYDKYAISRGFSNRSNRKRLRNIRDIKVDIRDALQEQASQDVAIIAPVKSVKPRRRKANMFEPDVELIDFESEIAPEDKPGFYRQRGPAEIKLLKKTSEPDDLDQMLAFNIAPLSEADINRVVMDDLVRVNAALKYANLVGRGIPPIQLSDLALDIPFFELADKPKTNERQRTLPFTPLMPAGLITVEPLGIYENI
jgi:hypothetical protein